MTLAKGAENQPISLKTMQMITPEQSELQETLANRLVQLFRP